MFHRKSLGAAINIHEAVTGQPARVIESQEPQNGNLAGLLPRMSGCGGGSSHSAAIGTLDNHPLARAAHSTIAETCLGSVTELSRPSPNPQRAYPFTICNAPSPLTSNKLFPEYSCPYWRIHKQKGWFGSREVACAKVIQRLQQPHLH